VSATQVFKVEQRPDGIVRATAADGHWWEGPPDEMFSATMRTVELPAFFRGKIDEDVSLLLCEEVGDADWR
jgi:hypothetical protein